MVEAVSIGRGSYSSPLASAEYDASLVSPATRSSAAGKPLSVRNVSKSAFSYEAKVMPDPDVQKWVASRDGVRIRISKDGWYRVTRSELEAAGFDVLAPTGLWQLYNEGRQQSIVVGPNGSYIEFLGKSYDTPETGQNAYFLVVGDSAGKRVQGKFIRRTRTPVLGQNFDSSFERHRRFLYTSVVRNGSAGNFFGEVINNAITTINFDLPGFDPSSSSARVYIEAQGLTITQHDTNVSINGNPLNPLSGVDRQLASQTLEIPASFLQETGNSLDLQSTASPSDISLLGKLKIVYKRKFELHENMLFFRTNAYKKTTLTGITDRSGIVFDITDPDNPREIGNADLIPDGPGFKIELPPNRPLEMLAVTVSGILQADSVEDHKAESLSDAGTAADFIIVSHANWLTEAGNWAAYRAGQGLQTKVIDVADVFDEFGYGREGASAIRSFLEFAHGNWQVPPAYVLLMGDGSYDPRDFEGNGKFNYVPPMMVDTLYEETGSDDAIADFDGDGLAEIPIGRIPVRDPSDVTDALQKVMTFESSLATAPARGSLCASDLPAGYDFETLCQNLQNQLPGTIPTAAINRGDANAKTNLLSDLNTGRYLVNYSGHGSVGVWAATSFFGQADVAALTNSNDLSLFTMLTCLNGYFLRPVPDGLSEALLRSDTGGAVAVWSSTGSTTPDVQEAMATRFFQQLGNGTMERLGDHVNDSKATIVGGRDVRLSWVLLGDPALKVKQLPPPAKNFKAGS